MANKEIITKGFLNALKDYGNIMAEKTKLNTELIANNFKAQQNFFWKQKEEEAANQRKMEFIRQVMSGGQAGGQGGSQGAGFYGAGPYGQQTATNWRPKGLTSAGDMTWEAPNPREERLSKNMVFANSTKLRQEFINRPEVKEYININTQVRSMDALLKKAKEGNIQNKVALDQGLITMYNKLTDPNSVVRESEYARTPQNLPLVNRFSGALQKIEKGGAGLTNADREALVWGAKVIANERGRTYNDTLQSYVDLAGQNDIDVGLVTRGLNQHQEYDVGGNNIQNNIQPKKVNPSISEDDIQFTMQKYGVSREEVLRRIGK